MSAVCKELVLLNSFSRKMNLGTRMRSASLFLGEVDTSRAVAAMSSPWQPRRAWLMILEMIKKQKRNFLDRGLRCKVYRKRLQCSHVSVTYQSSTTWQSWTAIQSWMTFQGWITCQVNTALSCSVLKTLRANRHAAIARADERDNGCCVTCSVWEMYVSYVPACKKDQEVKGQPSRFSSALQFNCSDDVSIWCSAEQHTMKSARVRDNRALSRTTLSNLSQGNAF